MKITIIGLGLIGGSLAIALRKSGFATTLIGVEANKQNAARALQLGLVDKIKPFTEGVKSADIVIVATPVNVAKGFRCRDTSNRHGSWFY